MIIEGTSAVVVAKGSKKDGNVTGPVREQPTREGLGAHLTIVPLNRSIPSHLNIQAVSSRWLGLKRRVEAQINADPDCRISGDEGSSRILVKPSQPATSALGQYAHIHPDPLTSWISRQHWCL
jgi:hypothetical protein